MADPGEDVQELKFMLQHYKQEYGREIQQLRDENVQLKARVALLHQKVDKQSELLKQASATGNSDLRASEARIDPGPLAQPSNVSLSVVVLQ